MICGHLGLGIALALAGGAAQALPAANDDAIVTPVKVTGASDTGPVVTLDAGSDAGLSARDQLFLLMTGGRVVTGELIAVGTSESGARVFEAVTAGDVADALVLRVDGLASLCRFLPLGAMIAGQVSRVVPGRTTAWIDLGRRSGLQLSDHILIRRATRVDGWETTIPIARGQVLQIADRQALISLQPLVGNAVAETGDSIELWPTPGQARIGRVNSAVLAVRPDPEGNLLTVVGSAADGFTEGRLLDLYRGSRFLGVASVAESGPRPLSRARMINSASVDTAREADTAILRAPAGPPLAPLLAPVFRIEGNYVLVAAGEVDGVQRDEKLRVQRLDPNTSEFVPAYEITIDKVKIDFSGGFSRQLDPAAPPLRTWELAERLSPPWPRWQAAGIVTRVDPEARTVTADVDPKSAVRPGDIIELAPGGDLRPGAAVVLWRTADRVIAAIPEGWGEIGAYGSAQVQVPRVAAGTRPAASGDAP